MLRWPRQGRAGQAGQARQAGQGGVLTEDDLAVGHQLRQVALLSLLGADVVEGRFGAGAASCSLAALALVAEVSHLGGVPGAVVRP